MKNITKSLIVASLITLPAVALFGVVNASPADIGGELANNGAHTEFMRPDRMRRPHKRFRGEKGKEALAEFFGMSEDELIATRKDGKTIQDLLEEQGKTQEELREFMRQKGQDLFEEKLANGEISEEDIRSMLERLEQRRDNISARIEFLRGHLNQLQ